MWKILSEFYIPGNFFLRYKREIFILAVSEILNTTRSFPKIPEKVRRLPKSSEVLARVQTRALSQCFSLQKSEIARKVLSFIHFTHGFRFLHGSELTYFWKLYQARQQQLTFFNQAWEIGPQAWAGVRSKFSTRRRETHAYGVRVGRYNFRAKKHFFASDAITPVRILMS